MNGCRNLPRCAGEAPKRSNEEERSDAGEGAANSTVRLAGKGTERLAANGTVRFAAPSSGAARRPLPHSGGRG